MEKINLEKEKTKIIWSFVDWLNVFWGDSQRARKMENKIIAEDEIRVVISGPETDKRIFFRVHLLKNGKQFAANDSAYWPEVSDGEKFQQKIFLNISGITVKIAINGLDLNGCALITAFALTEILHIPIREICHELQQRNPEIAKIFTRKKDKPRKLVEEYAHLVDLISAVHLPEDQMPSNEKRLIAQSPGWDYFLDLVEKSPGKKINGFPFSAIWPKMYGKQKYQIITINGEILRARVDDSRELSSEGLEWHVLGGTNCHQQTVAAWKLIPR